MHGNLFLYLKQKCNHTKYIHYTVCTCSITSMHALIGSIITVHITLGLCTTVRHTGFDCEWRHCNQLECDRFKRLRFVVICRYIIQFQLCVFFCELLKN